MRLAHTCFNKCIEKRHKEAELNIGGNCCIDRCISKYWQILRYGALLKISEDGLFQFCTRSCKGTVCFELSIEKAVCVLLKSEDVALLMKLEDQKRTI
ncbi:hypothetical protein BDA96_08G114600 [Sorghum bicolor]|uniref:Mitochondrial import inner membrane translocase subunit n=1 Tax=Sorghum bicolor TaxID=4558 RepID=A0A921U7S6_SORBI|nr:hypothetical protein BDA96_08G114600 [Sorghum bicolor]